VSRPRLGRGTEDIVSTLVVGARGAVGRHVVAGLREAGVAVRASVRDRTGVSAPEGVEMVEADLDRPDTLPAAVVGVRRAFLYATTPAAAAAFGRAAREAGVEHVVLLSSGSVLLPWALRGNAIAREHHEVEGALAGAGVPFTAVRPLVLAGNALFWADSIRDDRRIALAHPDAVLAPVHERDIAAVAVAALTGTARGHTDGLLTGGELLSQREQVAIIGRAAGVDIRVDELTEAEAHVRFATWADSPEEIDAVLEFLARATREPGPATTTARDVLGREPLPFTEWAREHAGSFR
jgi:uncharacterized protein YbjT (DUF2867 family)